MIQNGHIVMNPIVEALSSPGRVERLNAMFKTYNDKYDKGSDVDRKAALVAATGATANAEARALVAAAAVEKIALNVWAESTYPAIFEQTDLAEDEVIEIITTTQQGYNVMEINGHGYAPDQHYVNNDRPEHFSPYKISTGVIDFPIMSGVTGKLNLFDSEMENATRSLVKKINRDVYALLDTTFTTYPAGTEVVDPDIVAGVRPTTSLITASAETYFTFNVFKLAADHFLRLGKTLKLIVINPKDASGIWDWQDRVSSTSSGSQDGTTLITTRTKEVIEASGRTPSHLLGQEFVWLLDPTRAIGQADFYAADAGTLYKKPSLGGVLLYNEEEMDKGGYGEMLEGIKMFEWIKPLIKADQYRNKLRIVFI